MENDKVVAAAFNLWMDDFVNNPDAFRSATSGALRHLKERGEGGPVSYGDECAVVLREYIAKASAAAP